jgi:cell fate regulator YaaT (PSP1 superfamily)
MVRVVGIRFKHAGKIYYFDPDKYELEYGDHAIVETARGIEYGEVVIESKDVDEKEIVTPLKKVVRKATDKDIKKVDDNREKEIEAFHICSEKIEKHKLDMKMVDVEYTFDSKKIIFYFTADGRIDFRELVKDLAAVFRTRIELRQIGVRDQAKFLGGIGLCGRECCCCSFLGDFQPVSIKMAKDQNLSLSPTKISGLCGRLMCCLNYEYEHYACMKKKVPSNGSKVTTPEGHGIVIESNLISEKCRVKIELPDKTYDIRTYQLSELKFKKHKPHEKRKKDAPLDAEIEKLLD